MSAIQVIVRRNEIGAKPRAPKTWPSPTRGIRAPARSHALAPRRRPRPSSKAPPATRRRRGQPRSAPAEPTNWRRRSGVAISARGFGQGRQSLTWGREGEWPIWPRKLRDSPQEINRPRTAGGLQPVGRPLGALQPAAGPSRRKIKPAAPAAAAESSASHPRAMLGAATAGRPRVYSAAP